MQPDVLKKYPFIDTWRAKGYQYYTIQKSMLKLGHLFGLGIDEVMLHTILKDRARLSCKNNWIDDKGRVYIKYTRQNVADYIGWSKRKTINVFANLVASGLLVEVEQCSQTKMKVAKRLYVRHWGEPSLVNTVEDLKSGGFFYMTRDNLFTDMENYYSIPTAFFEDDALKGLSLRAIFMYMILLDEMHKSINCGKVDKNGKVWCKLNSVRAKEELRCSDRTLTTTYGELEKNNLLVRQRSGNGEGQKFCLRDYLPSQSCIADSTANELFSGIPAEVEHSDIPAPQTVYYSATECESQSRKICTSVPQNLHLYSRKICTLVITFLIISLKPPLF